MFTAELLGQMAKGLWRTISQPTKLQQDARAAPAAAEGNVEAYQIVSNAFAQKLLAEFLFKTAPIVFISLMKFILKKFIYGWEPASLIQVSSLYLDPAKSSRVIQGRETGDEQNQVTWEASRERGSLSTLRCLCLFIPPARLRPNGELPPQGHLHHCHLSPGVSAGAHLSSQKPSEYPKPQDGPRLHHRVNSRSQMTGGSDDHHCHYKEDGRRTCQHRSPNHTLPWQQPGTNTKPPRCDTYPRRTARSNTLTFSLPMQLNWSQPRYSFKAILRDNDFDFFAQSSNNYIPKWVYLFFFFFSVLMTESWITSRNKSQDFHMSWYKKKNVPTHPTLAKK